MTSPDDYVQRALKRWPNVPALFGWLGLDRRGRWLIQGETISHPLIVQTMDRNFAADEFGRWYFQNGPQRGYIELESAPFVLHVAADRIITHTQREVEAVSAAYLDEDGGVLLATEHGPGELSGDDLGWLLERMSVRGESLDDNALESALALATGHETGLRLELASAVVPVRRLNFEDAPDALGFVRRPTPHGSSLKCSRDKSAS